MNVRLPLLEGVGVDVEYLANLLEVLTEVFLLSGVLLLGGGVETHGGWDVDILSVGREL